MPLKSSQHQIRKIFKENQTIIKFSVFVFLALLIMWAGIYFSRLGFSTTEDYWYEAGVPVLLPQVILAVFIGIGYSLLEREFPWKKPQKIDQVVFILIWLITATLWSIQPAYESYVNPKPRAPNFEMYPYSDGIKYDVASQFMLIGQGINNQKPLDTPLYPLFLSFVHLISGQNYQNNMIVQAIALALFPAIAYLIGIIMHGRVLGITIASLLTLRGINSIEAASIISTASPKQMLTDFPSTLGVAFTILLVLYWFHKQKISTLIWVGAAIGFSFLIRSTTLALSGLIIFFIFLKKPTLAKRWQITGFIFLGFFVVLIPWGMRNTINGNDFILATYRKKINLVIEERFPDTNSQTEEIQSNEVEEKKKKNQESLFGVITIISNHFVHNIITSTLTLPTVASFESLKEVLKSPYMYWKPYWNGELNKRSLLLLIISLGILATGIATAFHKKNIVGLIPLLGFLLYQFANATGRTSGGRYIVPVDWILILYFAIGLVEIIYILTNMRFSILREVDSALSKSINTDNALRTTIIILSFALILPVSETLQPLRYHQVAWERKTIPNNPLFFSSLASTGYTKEQVKTFLETEKEATLITGRVLYPRYFFTRESLTNPEDAIFRLKYPRLEFILIGPNNKQTIILASQELVKLQNTSDVMVLGCDFEEGYIEFIDVIAFISYSPQQETIIRQPLPPLQCPLPKLTCDNNGNCQ